MTQKREQILIIKLGALGDVLGADGAIRDIRCAHPKAEITILTGLPYKKIFHRHPDINHVWGDARPPRWKIWSLNAIKSMLLSQPFDYVYDLQNNKRTELYFKWMTHSHVKWSGNARGASLETSAQVQSIQSSIHRLASRLTEAGLETAHSLHPDLRWMAKPEDYETVSNCLNLCGIKSDPYIVLIPGCSARHPEKRWPYYGDLANRLQKCGWQCVTAPGPDDIELCQSLPAHSLMIQKSGANANKVPLNFFELAALFQRSTFCIGNDTGPCHLAAWSRTQGLALFGPHTSAERTGLDLAWPVIETPDLKTLSVDTVFELVVSKLAKQTAFVQASK